MKKLSVVIFLSLLFALCTVWATSKFVSEIANIQQMYKFEENRRNELLGEQNARLSSINEFARSENSELSTVLDYILFLNRDGIQVRGTYYQGTVWQCDNTPTITASGRSFDPDQVPQNSRILAVSRDLLYVLSYGEQVYILIEDDPFHEFNGVWHVDDTMHIRFRQRVDFLVDKDYSGRGFFENVKLVRL